MSAYFGSYGILLLSIPTVIVTVGRRETKMVNRSIMNLTISGALLSRAAHLFSFHPGVAGDLVEDECGIALDAGILFVFYHGTNRVNGLFSLLRPDALPQVVDGRMAHRTILLCSPAGMTLLRRGWLVKWDIVSGDNPVAENRRLINRV
jgi:hypothetical protein